jgi:hypothetical protein
VQILNALARERRFEGLLRELRVPPRTREPPDIDDGNHGVLMKDPEEIAYRARRVADGIDPERRHRATDQA